MIRLAGLVVGLTAVLVRRDPLHHFVGPWLRPDAVRDGRLERLWLPALSGSVLAAAWG